VGQVAHIGERRCALQVFGGRNLRDRGHLEDPGVDGRIILEWIFITWGVGVWIGSS